MSGESTTGSVNTPANPRLEFVDADELAKRHKLQHIERIHRKAQQVDYHQSGFGFDDDSKFFQYKNLLWRYAAELAPLIEDALDHGIIAKDDTRIITQAHLADDATPDPEATVLHYARYRRIPDDLSRSRAQTVETLRMIYARLVRLEHRMRLGFTFEDDAQGELFIDELNAQEE